LLDLQSPDPISFLTLNAVNKKDRTITIKIHLDRQKEDIKNDLEFLLKLLALEAKMFDLDIGISKKPQWDIYDKYLQVYDMKKANPKMEWSEIAKEVFPREVDRNRVPVQALGSRKIRKSEKAYDTAVSKVRYFWKEANKMINKGGWRQI
jgi:hypothetical protein